MTQQTLSARTSTPNVEPARRAPRQQALPPPQETAWLGALLRQGRRDTDLSQRELAYWADVPKSVIGDIESGRSSPVWGAVLQLLATLGYEVVIHNRAGEVVEQLVIDERRDRNGRRFPPHLDVRELSPIELTERHWFENRPRPLTAWTYRLDREQRDRDRYYGWHDEGPHNWLPADPDPDYVRKVLGGDPEPSRYPPPDYEDWIQPRQTLDQRAVSTAGHLSPDARPRHPGDQPVYRTFGSMTASGPRAP